MPCGARPQGEIKFLVQRGVGSKGEHRHEAQTSAERDSRSAMDDGEWSGAIPGLMSQHW